MKHLELAPPATLSASARAQEITTILAAAIVRTLCPEVRPSAESGLGFLPDQSVYTTPYPQEFP
ncbi:hypothetical protein [Xanthomonas albilineans]|uniref:hypothetical protein n=1 Tax=Xanthomonas albilineans TaxID=29447 RepID=UPI0027D93C62|nr:hypothetical protein [Xanthomonas albilineans]